MPDELDEDIAGFLGSLNEVELPPDPEPPGDMPFEFEVMAEEPLKDDLKDDYTQVGDGVCATCGAPTFRPPGLTKAGHKKRVPKYCDLHGPNVQVPPIGPSAKGVESQLSRVQQELADDLRLLAVLAGPMLPVTGMYLTNQADAFTTAIIKLAKNNTAILRVLHRAAQVAPIYTVAETLAGTAYSVQVDMQKADPHNAIARRLRVQDAYNTVYPDEAQPYSNGATTFAPPPTYTVQ